MAESRKLIPKVIHYCWFGGKSLNRKAEKCIGSWKKYCSNYKIMRWNESNCNVDENQYVSEAFHAKKWAFVSDYFRLKAICKMGGIYLDTDVELIKPLNEFLGYRGFMGFEDNANVATCIMGGVPDHEFFNKTFELYQNRKFILDDGSFDTTTNVKYLTELLCGNGLVKNGKRQTVMNMEIFPSDYFSPKSLKTGKITLTENTCAIHHFEASWQSGKQKFHTKVAQIIGEKNTEKLKKLLGRE